MNQVLNRRHLLQLAAAAGLPAGQLAWAEKTTDQQTAPTADQALEMLMEGNARYVNGDMDVRDFYPNRQTLASGQASRQHKKEFQTCHMDHIIHCFG